MNTLSLQAQNIFYNVDSKAFRVVNDLLAATTIVAIAGIVCETVPVFVPYLPLLNTIEYIAVAIFTVEYIGRIIANYGHIRKYVLGYFGIIDLLSIVPTLFGLGNSIFLKSVRILRILRLLRMIRLAKLARMDDGLVEPEVHAHVYKLSVRIYFFALFSSVTIFGTLMYLAEGYRPEFASIPLGMIWAAKVSLGGVAQYMPETTVGDLITIAARFCGLSLFGLMISIIGGSLRWMLFGSQDMEEPDAVLSERSVRS